MHSRKVLRSLNNPSTAFELVWSLYSGKRLGTRSMTRLRRFDCPQQAFRQAQSRETEGTRQVRCHSRTCTASGQLRAGDPVCGLAIATGYAVHYRWGRRWHRRRPHGPQVRNSANIGAWTNSSREAERNRGPRQLFNSRSARRPALPTKERCILKSTLTCQASRDELQGPEIK